MPKLIKFNGYLVHPEHARAVVTPAYDAMHPQERREFAEQHPGNYVNVMRTLDEFATDQQPPSLEKILKHNLSSLTKLHDKGAFVKAKTPGYYLYRLQIGSHQQVGLVANIPLSDYAEQLLKKHEHTQVEKENMLTSYHEFVGVTSSPVCVGYVPRDGINSVVREVMESAPYLQFSAWDEVVQTIWRIGDEQMERQLEEEFGQIEETYLTDGHHRCESSIRYARLNSAESEKEDLRASFNQLFVALFPEDQLRILPYFRCVRDLNDLSESELISALKSRGIEVTERREKPDDQLLPVRAREITMLLDKRPYQLSLPNQMVSDDPVQSLDISILHDEILGPILGIHDARLDERIRFTPGASGIQGLLNSHQDGWRLGFACYQTTMEELKRVADAGQVMPPKSTWFDPKLRAGIFLRNC